MNRTEFTQKFPTQSNWLLRNNPALLDKVFPSKYVRWTLELCKQEALKYKTRIEWRTQHPKSYDAARRNKWLEECNKHMPILFTSWTLELCKQEALKYKTRLEWQKQQASSYQTARRERWLEECTKHMGPSLTAKKYVKNLDTQKVYESMGQAGKSINQKVSNIISSCCRGRQKTAGGYRWAYCDEQGNVLND